MHTDCAQYDSAYVSSVLYFMVVGIIILYSIIRMTNSMTILIAQYVGPAIFAVGLGIFLSKNYYTQVYRNLESETLAVLMGGLVTLVAGIAIVLNHNDWTSFNAGLITFLGWACVVKGLALIIMPNTVDAIGNKMADSTLFPFLALTATAVGGYVTYFAYFV